MKEIEHTCVPEAFRELLVMKIVRFGRRQEGEMVVAVVVQRFDRRKEKPKPATEKVRSHNCRALSHKLAMFFIKSLKID